MKTKCKLLILLVIFIVTGCSVIEQQIVNDDTVGIITYDNCQYLVVQNGWKYANNYSFSMTHKGNCNNPVHKWGYNERNN